MDKPSEYTAKSPTSDPKQDSWAPTGKKTSKRSNQNTPEVNSWIKKEEKLHQKVPHQTQQPHLKVTNNKVTPGTRRNGGKTIPNILAGISATSNTTAKTDFTPEMKNFFIELLQKNFWKSRNNRNSSGWLQVYQASNLCNFFFRFGSQILLHWKQAHN